ncbi:MAG: 3-deoxy-8-phosphooctulonate synthase [Fibrobacterota bacterium]
MADKPFFIAGPCVAESRELCFAIASRLKEIGSTLGVEIIFKASFDKANRSSGSSFRGPGMREGLEILSEVRESTGLRTITDVHETFQAEPAASSVDILQIPALLSRQTDLIVACAATGKPVNIKKGQFMSPVDIKGAVKKASRAGSKNVMVTERGTFFGYGDLVVDFRSFHILKKSGADVVFDATHSVQKPGAGRACSSGEPQFIKPLAFAAAATECDGFFFEVHPEPEKALCDGPNSLCLDDFEDIVSRILNINYAYRNKN